MIYIWVRSRFSSGRKFASCEIMLFTCGNWVRFACFGQGISCMAMGLG